MEDDGTVLGRAMMVIEACLDSTGPISLADLTAATGLPKPTVRRVANNLVQRDLLQRGPQGYISGSGLVLAGTRAAEQRATRLAATPFLEELHQRTNAAVWMVDVSAATHWPMVNNLYGPDQHQSRYAGTWPHSPTDPAVLATALGIVALTNRPADVELLIRSGIPRLTPYTGARPRQVAAAMIRFANSGIAVEHQGCVLGWSCLAVPVMHNDGSGVSAVLGLVSRTPRFLAARFATLAQASADAITADSQPEPRRPSRNHRPSDGRRD